jgi:putative redox protein
MDVTIEWTGGERFRGQTSDGRPLALAAAAAGEGGDPSPMQLLLAAAAGCTGIDVVSILEKMRKTLVRFSVRCTGERREEHPRAYRRIHLSYDLVSPDTAPHEFKRAVDLSRDKYCSVLASLSPTIEVSTTLLLNGEAIERAP